jgi:hypothetical protein
MAYVTPGTVAAGDVATAAAWNVVVGDIVDHETYVANLRTGFIDYTPTLTQGATVTKTGTSRYMVVNKLVTVYVALSITSTGTATNRIVITLPVTAKAAQAISGSGTLYDASSFIQYPAIADVVSTTTVALVSTKSNTTNGSQFLGQVDFTAALASGDFIGFGFTYEAA